MSNQENPQQPIQDVSVPIEEFAGNGSKDEEKVKSDPSAYIVEKSAVIDDLPSYEHASTDATPAYSASDPSNKPDPKPLRRNRAAQCCCLISFLIAISIVLAIISKTNSNVCNNINVMGVNPNISSFDPKVITSFAIDSSDTATQIGGSLDMSTFQNTSPDVTNVTLSTRIASPKQGNIYYTDNSQGSNYKLAFHQKSTSDRSFFNLFSPPDSCFRAHVDLIIPQQMNSPFAINVDNFDVILGNSTYNQSINVHTTTGDIILNRFNVTTATLYSERGDIHGRIQSLSNMLIVNSTSDGGVNLIINITPNVTNPKIYVNANQGDVRLRLNNSFTGTYNITTSGRVFFSINRKKASLPAQGPYGNGTATLEVISSQDVIIGF